MHSKANSLTIPALGVSGRGVAGVKVVSSGRDLRTSRERPARGMVNELAAALTRTPAFDELANLMMADTELCSRVAQCQPLAVLIGGAVAVNTMHASQVPDTLRRPGLALSSRHSHSVH